MQNQIRKMNCDGIGLKTFRCKISSNNLKIGSMSHNLDLGTACFPTPPLRMRWAVRDRSQRLASKFDPCFLFILEIHLAFTCF